jgi:hypothetical protein
MTELTKAAPSTIATRRLPALSPAAVDLLNNLPAEQSLQETARQFPHVVNGLVKHWDDSRELARVIDALLTDDRQGRKGFPMAVLMELVSIREWRVVALRNVRR